MLNNNYNFKEVIDNLQIEDKFIEAYPHGNGHINDTFAVFLKTENKGMYRIILQRINSNLFTDVPKLMQNYKAVTDFMRKRIVARNGDPEREVINLILAKDGKSYYIDKKGNYWRALKFVEGTISYEIVENPSDFESCGSAFGKFQRALAEFPADSLFEVIPNFHNTKKRFNDFLIALKNNKSGRADKVKDEIEFILKREDKTGLIVDKIQSGEIPLRVTHNDTKLNNVLIDEKTKQAICVIDLDTIMPGSSLYDFGDSIRFGTNPAVEDEKDLSKVYCDLNLFESYTKGFLKEVGDSLNDAEFDNLPIGAYLMTFECGIRFLTDYLDGDVYFKIRHENQNLDRCRTQIKMVQEIELKMDKMNEIVNKYRR